MSAMSPPTRNWRSYRKADAGYAFAQCGLRVRRDFTSFIAGLDGAEGRMRILIRLGIRHETGKFLVLAPSSGPGCFGRPGRHHGPSSLRRGRETQYASRYPAGEG